MGARSLAIGVMLFVAGSLGAATPEWSDAYDLYQRTEYNKSLSILLPLKDKDQLILQLIGQNYYMLADFKKATEFLEKAVQLNPNNAETCLWLGRAYGRRAETSGPFTAPGHASKARQMFERAVALDPSNREAVGDLFDFYLDAPGFLGGGQQKAEALAVAVARRDPAEGHYYMAQIDLRRNSFDSAEMHLRTALELAPKQAGRFLDLAKLLSKRGRTAESDQLFDQALQIAPNDPRILFERASVYVQENRNLDEARKLLQKYLRSPLTPNDPSRREAEALLKKIGA